MWAMCAVTWRLVTSAGDKIRGEDVTALAEALKLNSSVTTLRLFGVAFSSRLSSGIVLTTGPTETPLPRFDPFGGASVADAYLIRFFWRPWCASLGHMTFPFCSFGTGYNTWGEDVTALMEALKVNSSVTTLSLSCVLRLSLHYCANNV